MTSDSAGRGSPRLSLTEFQREQVLAVFNGVEDLLGGVSHQPTLREANRLLLGFFLILDALSDEDQATVRNCGAGRSMLRHCDAVYCALSYEHGSYDGDVGDTWVPLRETLRTILIHVLTGSTRS